MAKDYEEENGSATIALNGTLRHCSKLIIIAARQMFTEEIFHDPNVRKFFRELYLGSMSRPSRATYSVKPTERGLKKIDDNHPYYV
jgi:transcription elongation factor SPT6